MKKKFKSFEEAMSDPDTRKRILDSTVPKSIEKIVDKMAQQMLGASEMKRRDDNNEVIH